MNAADDATVDGDAYFAQYGFRRTTRPFDAKQTRRRLADVTRQAAICARIVADGRERFDAESFEGLKTRMAATRSIEIIAEATTKLHSDYKEHFPQAQWRTLYRMRTLAVHHYDKVRDDLIWAAISTNMPAMVDELGLPASPDEVIELPTELRG